MLRIFTSVKIQRLRPGFNPRPWAPEASMLTTRPPKPSSCNLLSLSNDQNLLRYSKVLTANLTRENDYPKVYSGVIYCLYESGRNSTLN
jgi:hypothetical protein